MKTLLLTFVFVIAASAMSPAPLLSQKKLDSTIHYWQHILGLDSLKIHGIIEPIKNMPAKNQYGKDVYGATICNDAFTECTLYVLQPADYTTIALEKDEQPLEGNLILKDIENTIVHELIHMRLHALTDINSDNPKCRNFVCQKVEEITVVRLTEAILNEHKLRLQE